jgi:hypothetical protein
MDIQCVPTDSRTAATNELYSVEWSDNPLATKVRLTTAGMLRLKLGIATDAVYGVRSCLQLAKEQQDLKWCDYDDVGSDVEAYIEGRVKWCVDALADVHCGDCTCVPMSCAKCYAEEMLGFFTTDGLGKHEGHAVSTAFAGGRATIDQAIEYLRGPIVPIWGTAAEWEPHMERWREQRDRAIEWLTEYRKLLHPAPQQEGE